MPRFNYTVLDASGAEQTGHLEAATAENAMLVLKSRGFFPIELAMAGAAPVVAQTGGSKSFDGPAGSREGASAPTPKGLAREIRMPFLRPIAARELAIFTRQLGTMLRAGMPLLRGLEVLARQADTAALRRVINSLADDIRSGAALSEGMARHPKVFDRLFLNMVKAGEAGGMLDVALERLAAFQEKSVRLRGRVKAAMIYPLIVLFVAVAILAGLLVFVVPKFQQIFADLLRGAPLPALTQAVLAASEFVRSHYLVALGVLLGSWILLNFFRRTPTGNHLMGRAALRLPLFGDLIVKSIVARFTRTFGTLLSSGVPILQALRITRDTTGNACVATALDRVHDRVKAGDTVARPLEETRIFPGMVTGMIDVGEHTGRLPEMLQKVADIYDDEVDTAVAGFSSLIEPVLLVFLAGIVGTIVVALFLPIVRIVQLLT